MAQTAKPDGLERTKRYVISGMAVAWAAFHLYTGLYSPFPAMLQRSIHLAFAAALLFLTYPAWKTARKKWPVPSFVADIILALAGLFATLYVAFNWGPLSERAGFYTSLDLAVAVAGLIIVLEMGRRTSGWILPAIAVVAVLYALFGKYAPDLLAHRGLSPTRLFTQMYYSTEGIYGVALGVSSTILVLFLIFAAFLKDCGATGFFVDIAKSLFGQYRGGPAKIAVMASALFGMVSGSAVSNAMVVGQFTIPMMKSLGYRNHVAGAIEAVASTGGQLMPPIMGSSAFVMAELLQIRYFQVCVAAALPAVLFYLTLFFVVDFEAARLGLKGLPKAELPKVGKVLKESAHTIIPLIFLLAVLGIWQWTETRAAFWATAAAVVVSFVRKDTRMGLKKILRALEQGAKSAIDIAAVCALLGVIIGVVMLSGIGLKLSAILIDLSGGNLIVLLALTMIASILLGTGLPTIACYVILAALVAPALVEMGIQPIAAHMFVFYFGLISFVTPPVALAAYATASLAGANFWRTGLTATRFAIAGFIVPYMFVFGPALLLKGSLDQILMAVVFGVVGVYFLAAGVQGYLLTEFHFWERILSIVAGVFFIYPSWQTDAIGIALAALLLCFQWLSQRRKRRVPATGG